jgi:DNA-binding MarR family transcriptional regulator
VDQKTRAQQAVKLLMLTDRLHRAAIEAQIEKLGIHRSQHFVLMHLSHSGGGISQSEIAKRLDVSPAAVTVTLQKLEKSGLIERQNRQDDARTKIITLTDAGRQTVEVTHRLFLEVDEQMCGGMTGEELDTLCACLSKMTENLKAQGHTDPCCADAKEGGKA